MERVCSIHFPKEFFEGLSNMSFSKIISIKKNEELLSFGLLLGNNMYIQGSTKEGRRLCANNLLYDHLYQSFEKNKIFLGTSFKGTGHFHFKSNSGATPLPASPTGMDLMRIQKYFLHNMMVGKVAKRLDVTHFIEYCLPY